MNAKLLSLVVPTYNRADCLEVLLETLERELEGLRERVAIIIGDNASSDRTPDVIAAFVTFRPDTVVLRHAQNLGPEENFCRCIERVDSPYFWLLGDDDLPRAGSIRHLVELLEREEPDLVYLESEWRTKLVDNDQTHPVVDLRAFAVDRRAFARRIHVWSTFISGMIVRRGTVAGGAAPLRRFTQTSLIQLGWIFDVLERGSRFIHVTTPCVLATMGNTGGYKVLKVFGQNFPAIVTEALHSDRATADAIVRRTSIVFLPDLLWNLRFGRVGTFDHEDPSDTLRPYFGRTLAFLCVLQPIGHGARLRARCALAAAHLGARLLRAHDRLIERLRGTARLI
jgi:hypothetical protein